MDMAGAPLAAGLCARAGTAPANTAAALNSTSDVRWV